MGVPSLFRWIAKRYPKSINKVANQGVDNLYLDLNGIIHPCCHPRGKDAPGSEKEMFQEIFRMVDHLVAIVRPKQLMYIAVDGVAPRAKMNQQRERRFRPKDPTDGHVEGGFDPNTITPGTPFMYRLHTAITRYIEQRQSAGVNGWKQLAVIYSGCDVPGEGEHKIYDFVRSIKGSGVRHVICGLDADLIFLSLATHEQSFRVLREDVFFLEREERSSCQLCKKDGHSTGNCNPNAFPPYIYLDIDIIRRYLYTDFSTAINARFDFERILDDWIFVCFFVGNDFLPSIPSMDIKVAAIETITGSYLTNLITRRAYLTQDRKINMEELAVLMKTLGEQEDALLRSKLSCYVKAAKRRGETPRDEDLRIKLFEEKGRNEYYQMKMHASTPEEITNSCIEYIKGLSWILEYYYNGCPSWEWYYPMHFAPLARDIAETLLSHPNISFEFEVGKARKPLEQVMAVLPQSSSSSIPEGLYPIFKDMPENYPETIKIDMFGKTQAWQGVPLIPFLDCDKMVTLVREYSADLPLEDIYRNVEGQDLLFLPTENKNYTLGESVYTNFSKSAGIKIMGKFYAGRATIHSAASMPGETRYLMEEGKNYTVRSISVVFVPVKKQIY
ncbi:uncharacterized protein NESG_02029 [Nematocida ausubeli]|uniref:Uncharacterized protein n=1 Tax=Nematocida ausubeli (strain ATCC PRA-371 / ERTm2) TaxID=1913371 RepID=H8ZBU7_NEMA1|nr:uncharacterized protein NESG_02029 [Nematocida ausubeli]EHY65583.1 hypothetical protein NERG_01190 [Nematocida ausubeli]KAI5135613.1 hypothetical protein NEAUS06_1558 [Nematocida ausubeli]KAI5135696.1 hypothetical protein NEAUS07_1300 [Nematocida ausubeli]KAI5137657.1 hypothetical protein NEAUS06_2309 [Nematocida ausubeli]KAI5138636.1 hypothetical protein NEAUS07_2407 [Nematocida ausubeli]